MYFYGDTNVYSVFFKFDFQEFFCTFPEFFPTGKNFHPVDLRQRQERNAIDNAAVVDDFTFVPARGVVLKVCRETPLTISVFSYNPVLDRLYHKTSDIASVF